MLLAEYRSIGETQKQFSIRIGLPLRTRGDWLRKHRNGAVAGMTHENADSGAAGGTRRHPRFFKGFLRRLSGTRAYESIEALRLALDEWSEEKRIKFPISELITCGVFILVRALVGSAAAATISLVPIVFLFWQTMEQANQTDLLRQQLDLQVRPHIEVYGPVEYRSKEVDGVRYMGWIAHNVGNGPAIIRDYEIEDKGRESTLRWARGGEVPYEKFTLSPDSALSAGSKYMVWGVPILDPWKVTLESSWEAARPLRVRISYSSLSKNEQANIYETEYETDLSVPRPISWRRYEGESAALELDFLCVPVHMEATVSAVCFVVSNLGSAPAVVREAKLAMFDEGTSQALHVIPYAEYMPHTGCLVEISTPMLIAAFLKSDIPAGSRVEIEISYLSPLYPPDKEPMRASKSFTLDDLCSPGTTEVARTIELTDREIRRLTEPLTGDRTTGE